MWEGGFKCVCVSNDATHPVPGVSFLFGLPDALNLGMKPGISVLHPERSIMSTSPINLYMRQGQSKTT